MKLQLLRLSPKMNTRYVRYTRYNSSFLFALIGCCLMVCTISMSAVFAASEHDDDLSLRKIIKQYALSGTPFLNKPHIFVNTPLAQLGKRLFFSTFLGGKSDTACVSCHHPMLGGGDNLALSIGVNAIDPKLLGPGRKHSPKGFGFDGGPTVPRNAQTTFNSVFYSRCMFWDCRIESLGATPGMNGSDDSIMRTPDTMWGMPRMPASSLLQAQVAFPVTSEDEMRAKFMENDDNNELREALAKRLIEEQSQWLSDFRVAFNSQGSATDLIRFENITLAIAAYEASQVFVNTPWSAYVKGDIKALSSTAKAGALLFYLGKEQGGYNCVQCHKGDFFTDEEFHVVAIPQIGRGKEDGSNENHDYGRFVQTGESDDKFAFRTPTLLNVEVTGPYGHSGSYKDLRGIISHMLNPAKALELYDFELNSLDRTIQKTRAQVNTAEALSHLIKLQSSGKSKITSFSINETHVDQLHEFLISLTDPCVKSAKCLSDWIE